MCAGVLGGGGEYLWDREVLARGVFSCEMVSWPHLGGVWIPGEARTVALAFRVYELV